MPSLITQKITQTISQCDSHAPPSQPQKAAAANRDSRSHLHAAIAIGAAVMQWLQPRITRRRVFVAAAIAMADVA